MMIQMSDTVTETQEERHLHRMVRRWLVEIWWSASDEGAFVKAEWTRPNGVEGGTGWHQMIPEYPPSQMIDNPGDKTPPTIQGAIWSMCDAAWRAWQEAPSDAALRTG